MSKDIIVLTPNGRRQKIHCTPDTSILQVLEDVCQKQGFQASDYDLKHHNHVLDLTTTLRFSNLPNKAMLEMIEVEKKRKESNVTIGLQLEDGERKTADFPPTTTLYEIAMTLAPSEVGSINQPTISYMRQEIVGVTAMRDKTLRQLGLIKGGAILRLMNKQEAKQANVSSVYRKPVIVQKVADIKADIALDEPIVDPPPISATTENTQYKQDKYQQPDIVTKFKQDVVQSKKLQVLEESVDQEEKSTKETIEPIVIKKESVVAMDVDSNTDIPSLQTQENLERRLKIEEEVTFLGNQKAIAFMQPSTIEEQLEDLPDDFYDLSIEEVRKLYHDLQQNRICLENTPLLSTAQRDQNSKQEFLQKLNSYKHAVVRIQFPDHIILQGVFLPTNTIEDVRNFIKEFVREPNKMFQICTPGMITIEPTMTLMEARFVPCVHMHFKWLENDPGIQTYLKEEIYLKTTATDAANILASKYRAPSRRKDDSVTSLKSNKPSTSKGGKVPSWFK